MGSIPTRGNEVFNIFISSLRQLGIAFLRLTRNVAKILHKMRNGVLRNTRFTPPTLLYSEYSAIKKKKKKKPIYRLYLKIFSNSLAKLIDHTAAQCGSAYHCQYSGALPIPNTVVARYTTAFRRRHLKGSYRYFKNITGAAAVCITMIPF